MKIYVNNVITVTKQNISLKYIMEQITRFGMYPGYKSNKKTKIMLQATKAEQKELEQN